MKTNTIEIIPCVQINSSTCEGTGRVHGGRAHKREAAKVVDFDRHSRSRRMEMKRAKRVRQLQLMAARAVMIALLAFAAAALGFGGIASRAQSRQVPVSYKYYDTVTVAYQENLLDIVERYDDRDHYATQDDYVRDLCMINNIEYDGTAYPQVTPGTKLVVPYYSQELK